ncbi:MAG TPA: hypothetical protein PKD54_00480, partial [Pirellulaceae bacterium]|nr:hypothetical protein [Pirellulaceae bacterium]
LIEWESPSRDSVPALSMPPLDAAAADSWVSLGLELGRQLNSAHQATVLFAHWPGHYHPAFHDLLTLTRQSPLLGNWVSVEEALSSAYHPGYGDAFGCDEYRTPILEQSVQHRSQSPISKWIDYWRGTAQCLALEGLAAMLEAVTKNASAIRSEINDLRLAIEEQVDRDGTATEGLNADSTCSLLHAQLIRDLMQAMSLSECDQPDQKTWLHFNPTGRARLGAPPWGFHCASASEHSSAPNPTPSKPSLRTESLLWSHGLCNRQFELEIDLQRGGIKAVRLHRQRGNVLSQRLAIRLDGLGSGEDAYADTVMDHWETRLVHDCGQSRAEAITRGRFQIDEECLGRFEQTILIDQDSPLIEVHIDLSLERELAPVPWREYVCSRWAWTDPTARRFADQLETRQPVRLERFTAPLAVEVEDERCPTAMLPCGAPFHRQSAGNILDTLLIVAGERQRTFRLAWVIDHGCALRWAQSLLVPLKPHQITKPLTTPTARFYALAPSHVVAWRIDPVYDKSGRISGSTWWVRETMGRDGQVELDSPHPLTGAALMDLTGQVRQQLTPVECRVSVPFRAFEILGIQMEWANNGYHD